MLSSVRDELRFVPNDYCNSLTLSSLSAPTGASLPLVIIIISAVAVMAMAVGAVSIVKARRKKRALAKKQG